MYSTLSITTAALPESPVPGLSFPCPSSPLGTQPAAPLCILVSPAQPLLPDCPGVPLLDIATHFAQVPDPRHRAFPGRHLLSDVLVIALSAMLCGAKSWEAIADFGRTKQAWFRSIGLQLRQGTPSHDTFERIFAALDPLAFQNAFTSWINGVCRKLGLGHVPIDGKACRGAIGPEGTCLHLVSAWAHQQRLSLAQVAVADKSNEITAIPEVLKMLDLHGALVSIDAIGCQKNIARDIRDGKGDYLLAVKENQPTLYAAVQACFDEAFANDFEGVEHEFFVMEEVSHGRNEERCFAVIYEPQGVDEKGEWKDLQAIVRVGRLRRVGQKRSIEVSYFITSSTAGAKVLAEATRDHWSIENRQHWVLDVIFGEDRCRSNSGHAAENLAWLRKMVLSVFAQDESKGSIPTRQFRAAADDDYRLLLLKILSDKYA